ncbi:MAG TPA: hypothetical protein VK779_06135 [Rhizomicrobium sp.]|jgi:hypothetical protein|nr:hypothetical protein [Rhizomicrobium sp.]
MSADTQKVERLIAMAERLIEALEADMAALERGKPQEMRTIDPEIQKLSAIYGREAAGLNEASAKAAPSELRVKLTTITKRFSDTLARHRRLVTRVKNASEGMIRAIAEEVGKKQTAQRPYGRTPSQTPRPVSAMIYNNVV